VSALEGAADLEELQGLALEFDLRHGVDVPVLRGAADGLGAVEARDADEANAPLGKLAQSALDLFERISFVRAEAQKEASHPCSDYIQCGGCPRSKALC
jgi:hypothetical protein